MMSRESDEEGKETRRYPEESQTGQLELWCPERDEPQALEGMSMVNVKCSSFTTCHTSPFVALVPRFVGFSFRLRSLGTSSRKGAEESAWTRPKLRGFPRGICCHPGVH